MTLNRISKAQQRINDIKSMWKFLKIICSVLIGLFAVYLVAYLHFVFIGVGAAGLVDVLAETLAYVLIASWVFLLSLAVFSVVSFLIFTAITKFENRP